MKTVTLSFELNEDILAQANIDLDNPKSIRTFRSALIRGLELLDCDYDEMRHTTDEERAFLLALRKP